LRSLGFPANVNFKRCNRTVNQWFLGVEAKSKKAVFVKDVWRTNVPGVETEGTILEELMAADVRNIPGLVSLGDVRRGGETSPF